MGKNDEDFVSNIKTTRQITTSFIIANKKIKVSRRDLKFIQLVLTDKSGEIVGNMFFNNNSDAEKLYEKISERKPHIIRGHVQEYKGRYNIKVEGIHVLDESEYDITDYIRITSKNQEEMMKEIISTIDRIENPHLKLILESFFEDDNFIKKFYDCPAAKTFHHNYVGGLLEHTTGVLRICKTISEVHPELNQSLLYTGAILHDVGKIRAYDHDMISTEMSEKGIFLEHLIMSNSMIEQKLDIICNIIEKKGDIEELEEFQKTMIHLQHLILSHHGEKTKGWGSAVDPQTPEALALHHADNMDAKVKSLLQKTD